MRTRVSALAVVVGLIALVAMPGVRPSGQVTAQDTPGHRQVVPGLAANAPGDRPGESALARSLLLPEAEFDGWTETGASDVVLFDHCEPGLLPGQTALASTPGYADVGTGRAAYQSVALFELPGDTDAMLLAMEDAVGCIVQEIRSGAASTGEFELFDVEVFPPDGDNHYDDSLTFRLDATTRVDISGLTIEADFVWDIIVVAEGRAVSILHLQRIMEPVDAATRETLISAALDRISEADLE